MNFPIGIHIIGISHLILQAECASCLIDHHRIPISQRNLILFSVPIRVLVTECNQHFLKFIQCGRNFQSKIIQPFCINPLLGIHLSRRAQVNKRKRIDVSVCSQARLLCLRILLKQLCQIRCILFNQFIQNHQLSASHTVCRNFIRCNPRSQEYIRKLIGCEQKLFVFRKPVCRDFLKIHVNIRHFLILLENIHFLPFRLILITLSIYSQCDRLIHDGKALCIEIGSRFFSASRFCGSFRPRACVALAFARSSRTARQHTGTESHAQKTSQYLSHFHTLSSISFFIAVSSLCCMYCIMQALFLFC